MQQQQHVVVVGGADYGDDVDSRKHCVVKASANYQRVDDACLQQPLQLPHPIYKVFKEQTIEGWLLLVDSTDGNRSVCNTTKDGNMRACCCVLITKSTKEMPEYAGFLTASLTGAVYGTQKNSENGWSAWTSSVHHRKMKEFRKKDGGPGFVNFMPFGPLFTRYRDILCWVKRETAICKYYHTQQQIEEMLAHVSIEQVLCDLFAPCLVAAAVN